MEKNQARSRLKPKKEPLFKKYLHYIFSLLIALFFYLLIYLLLTNIYPSQIQNFIFNNSYLPLFLLISIANFFFFTFLLLNKKHGFIIAFIIDLILYFRISHIYFNAASFLVIFFISLGLILLAFPPRLFYNRHIIILDEK